MDANLEAIAKLKLDYLKATKEADEAAKAATEAVKRRNRTRKAYRVAQRVAGCRGPHGLGNL